MSEIPPQREIRWVKLTLDFPAESEAMLEAKAQAEGMSLACCCVRLIYNQLLRTATGGEKVRLEEELPLVLHRNSSAPNASPE